MADSKHRIEPFYPIFDSAGWFARLVPLGIRFAQLRIKPDEQQVDQEQLLAEILKTKRICEQYSCQLVVNDHWQLAIAGGCDFVHLGQEDLQAADLPAIKSAGVRFGISTHSVAELEHALSFSPHYIALGPVYPTTLKKMPWQPQGLQNILRWRQRIGDCPLVAIGGMNPQRAPGAFRAGADCVAMVTDITLNPNPEARVRQWLKLTAPYNHGCPEYGIHTLS